MDCPTGPYLFRWPLTRWRNDLNKMAKTSKELSWGGLATRHTGPDGRGRAGSNINRRAGGKLKQIIILKLIEGTTPCKGAKAQSGFFNNTLPHCYSTRAGGANRGGATAHGTRRRGRRGRVDNPPYRTTGTRGRAQGDDARRVQGEARFCVSTGRRERMERRGRRGRRGRVAGSGLDCGRPWIKGAL